MERCSEDPLGQNEIAQPVDLEGETVSGMTPVQLEEARCIGRRELTASLVGRAIDLLYLVCGSLDSTSGLGRDGVASGDHLVSIWAVSATDGCVAYGQSAYFTSDIGLFGAHPATSVSLIEAEFFPVALA